MEVNAAIVISISSLVISIASFTWGLYRDSRAIRPKVFAEALLKEFGGRQAVAVRAINRGPGPVTIQSVVVLHRRRLRTPKEFQWWSRKMLDINPPPTTAGGFSMTFGLPVKLGPADEATFLYPPSMRVFSDSGIVSIEVHDNTKRRFSVPKKDFARLRRDITKLLGK